MSTLAIDKGHAWFLRDGRPHVPLVDTAWNAFAEAGAEEWEEYLRFRRAQGFTGVLVSALPTWHDRSENNGTRTPYAIAADGGFDFSQSAPEYFVIARRRLERMVAHGLTPFLVVLWSNYVEGSPSNGIRSGMSLPADRRTELVTWIIDEIADLEPVILISGDDPFTTETSARVYREILDRFAAEAPRLLLSFHMWPDAELPEDLARHPAVDFITLQSGHTADDGAKAIELAVRASAGDDSRPILNLEPCYEGHGHVRATGRFSAAEVRRVLWTSLVSGASAGLGYGAHGLWQWHRAGSTFTQATFSGAPFPWRTALQFGGATDAAFARSIWEQEGLFRVRPAQELADRDDDGVRVAASDETVVIYAPSARALSVGTGLTRSRGWDLTSRAPMQLAVESRIGGTSFGQADVNGDYLIIADRERT